MKNKSKNDEFAEHLSRFVGETVTIFTASGGLSGQGFTGVILSVNNCFVRLTTRIGPAPGCPLGNGCIGSLEHNYGSNHRSYRYSGRNYGNFNEDLSNSSSAANIGSVADIPINHIVSFVHNAV